MTASPKLTVAILEGNCSWLPWLLYRLDERYELYEGLDGVINLSEKPSDLFRRQCFISVDVDEYLVNDVIRHFGDDHLVFTTDYPHSDCKFPHAIDTFFEMDGISDESRKKILWGQLRPFVQPELADGAGSRKARGPQPRAFSLSFEVAVSFRRQACTMFHTSRSCP